VTRFEAAFLAEVRDKHADVLATIRSEGEISDETEAKLKSILDGFAKTFA
jgi:F-type H+-transporting ATPase subunit alpha